MEIREIMAVVKKNFWRVKNDRMEEMMMFWSYSSSKVVIHGQSFLGQFSQGGIVGGGSLRGAAK
jgi:hypothetical protein